MQLTNFLLYIIHEFLLLVLVIPLLSFIIFSLFRDEDIVIIYLIDFFLQHVISFFLNLHLIFNQILFRLKLIDKDLFILAFFSKLLRF